MGKYGTESQYRQNMGKFDITSSEQTVVCSEKRLNFVLCGSSVLATVIRNASARQTKTVRFLQVAFDTTGESFLAGDHHGNIYVFDISRNRYILYFPLLSFHTCSFLLLYHIFSYVSFDRFKLVQEKQAKHVLL